MLGALSGGGRIELKDVPSPQVGPNDALVMVRAVGVCETDVHISLRSKSHAQNPRIMGHEWSGTIEAIPDGFDLEAGSRVVGEGMVACGTCAVCKEGRINLCAFYEEIGFSLPGAYAEYLAIPARNLHPLPASMSFEEGTFVEPTAVALHAVDLSGMQEGNSVVVVGPGPIGLLAVQIASFLGAGKVMLTGTREDRLALGQKLGADQVINVTEVDPVETVMEATMNGPEVVLDAAGTKSSFHQSVGMVAKGGTVVLVGAWDQVTWSPGVMIGKEMTIKGSLASPGAWERSIQMIEKGRIEVLPLITHRFKLSQIVEAFHLVDRRGDGIIKAVLFP